MFPNRIRISRTNALFFNLYLFESPVESSHEMGENIRSLSMESHADGRPTHNGVRPGSPTGRFMTLLSLHQYFFEKLNTNIEEML